MAKGQQRRKFLTSSSSSSSSSSEDQAIAPPTPKPRYENWFYAKKQQTRGKKQGYDNPVSYFIVTNGDNSLHKAKLLWNWKANISA